MRTDRPKVKETANNICHLVLNRSRLKFLIANKPPKLKNSKETGFIIKFPPIKYQMPITTTNKYVTLFNK